MKWFGESWQAPLNETCERAETPVGQKCSSCTKPIEDHDRGVLIPAFRKRNEGELGGTGLLSAWTDEPMHLRCLMETVLGPSWETILGSHTDHLIERSSIGSAAWVECPKHGHEARDPFTERCIQCEAEEAEAKRGTTPL